MIIPTHFIVHYGEIAIKGKNRPWFEKILIENTKKSLTGEVYGDIAKLYGRFVIEILPKSNIDNIKEKLLKIFGISNICIAHAAPFNIEGLKNVAEKLVNEDATTVRVLTKRADKSFPLSSMDANAAVGSYLIQKKNVTIDLVDAKTTLWIELVNKKAFVYSEKIDGLRGLPVGSSGKAMVLLSGGIDSPVAAYLIMKRGCKPIFVHFHSSPQTSPASKEKVIQLAKKLAQYHQGAKLYLVPFLDIQRQMMTATNKKLRVVLYRRAMIRIAEMIASKERISALVTGDNLAQVASQTLKNIAVIEDAAKLPILRPLLCYDKQEIINIAEKIGTYIISTLPHEDCCTVFVPKHPAIEADLASVIMEEKKLDLSKLYVDAVRNAEVMHIEF